MKQLNLIERFIDWMRHRLVSIMPDSLKRLVLYELCDRVNLKKTEEVRDEWSVTFEQMYETLTD